MIKNIIIGLLISINYYLYFNIENYYKLKEIQNENYIKMQNDKFENEFKKLNQEIITIKSEFLKTMDQHKNIENINNFKQELKNYISTNNIIDHKIKGSNIITDSNAYTIIFQIFVIIITIITLYYIYLYFLPFFSSIFKIPFIGTLLNIKNLLLGKNMQKIETQDNFGNILRITFDQNNSQTAIIEICKKGENTFHEILDFGFIFDLTLQTPTIENNIYTITNQIIDNMDEQTFQRAYDILQNSQF